MSRITPLKTARFEIHAAFDAAAASMSPVMREELQSLIDVAPSRPRARQWAEWIGMPHGTLNGRFRRAGLPSPKDIVAYLRLAYLAHLLDAGVTIDVAVIALNYSSISSLNRHLTIRMRETIASFRTYSGSEMTQRWIRSVLNVEAAAWATFDPYPPVGQSGAARCRKKASPRQLVAAIAYAVTHDQPTVLASLAKKAGVDVKAANAAALAPLAALQPSAKAAPKKRAGDVAAATRKSSSKVRS